MEELGDVYTRLHRIGGFFLYQYFLDLGFTGREIDYVGLKDLVLAHQLDEILVQLMVQEIDFADPRLADKYSFHRVSWPPFVFFKCVRGGRLVNLGMNNPKTMFRYAFARTINT